MPKKKTKELRPAVKGTVVPATKDEIFLDIVRAAHKDEAASERVIQIAKEHGALAGLLALYNQADLAEASLICALHPNDFLGRRLAKEHLDLMKSEIAGQNPTALEKLLAERIALCWLNVNFYETLIANQALSMPMPQADHLGKHLDQAHRRLLGAIKELAQLRKLQPPIIQVNIGQNQVNGGQAEVAQVNVPANEENRQSDGRLWESSCVVPGSENAIAVT